MKSYRDLPIKHKLLVIIMVTTGIGLSLAGAGILAVDSLLFRTTMERDLRALASIVADNSTAALEFDDARVATETLSALRERPHLDRACLYRSDGQVFARYSRSQPGADCPAPASQEGVELTPSGMKVTRRILLDGRPIGTLVMLYDRGEILERTQLYGLLLIPILVVSSLLALLLSSRLRERIATPISRLAEAAVSVSESGNYGIRAQKDSEDELGLLVDAFNEMLQHIQLRDKEVQEARTSMETTLTSIGDAVIATDREGRIVFANPVAQSLLRWPKPDIIGKPIEEVFRIQNELTRQTLQSPVQKVLREGKIVGLANHTILIARDGSEIPIDDSAAPIRNGGQIAGVVLVFRDITDRRRAQRDAAYLAAIVESSDDAIIGKSPDGIIQTWNAGAERLFGYKPEEVVGHPMLQLVPADRQHEELQFLARLRAGDRVVHFETVRMRKDGSPVDVSLSISPIRDRAGQVVGISHVARDITEQKRTAEQLRQTQKLESLGVLAGGIAHDFNNLLTGILGNASLALDEVASDARAKESLEAVIAASERAAQLAQQMLAYSGKGRFVVEKMNLSGKVREILPLIKAAMPSTVNVRLELEEQLPPIEADATQMQQLVMNVILNGAEAIPAGTHGELTIVTRRQTVDERYVREHAPVGADELPPGLYVLFEVRDTGAGMDEPTLSRIFDPFFTTKFTGRGLGLAAVLGIVRGHHGTVEVSSKPGQGTIFRFLFPAAGTGEEAKTALEKPGLAELGGSGVILVVDDEEIVRSMAKQALQRYGYQVLLAADGARGVDIFRHEADAIRCVVLDLTMPVMSGEETLMRMKAVRPDIPIILSSGFHEAQAVQQFEGKGLAGFLQKPYKGSELVQKIRSVTVEAAARHTPAYGPGSRVN